MTPKKEQQKFFDVGCGPTSGLAGIGATTEMTSPLARRVILWLYTATIVLSVAWTKVSVGIPIRSSTSLLLLLSLILLKRKLAIRAIERVKVGTALIGYFAFVGGAVSALNYTPVSSIFSELIEIHFQSLVLLILTAVVAECCGPRATLNCFLVVIVVSAIVAVGQALQIGSFWSLTEMLAAQKGPDAIADLIKRRPLGISYSQTVFAGQICLAIAAFCLAKCSPRQIDGDIRVSSKVFFSAAFCGLVVAMATGNRAPLLGVVLGACLFLTHRYGRTFILLIPLAIVLNAVLSPLLDSLSETGLRAVQTGDMSSLGRLTLAKYGALLFLNNPLGYGLDFNPTIHGGDFYEMLAGDPGVRLIMFVPLHNYPLTILNMYGILAFLALPTVLLIFSRSWTATVLFVPYMTHCVFHNSGPFFAENYGWYVIGCVPLTLTTARASWTGWRKRRADGGKLFAATV